MAKQIKIEEFNPERRKLSDLVEFPDNPRILTPERRQFLIDSVNENGRTNPPIINTDNTVIGGNQRLEVFMELFGPDQEIWVMVPPRKLTKNEAEKLNLRDNVSIGKWDGDIIVEKYDVEYLRGIGFEDFELLDMGYDFVYEDPDGEDPDTIYTKKIEAPIYTPSDGETDIRDLVNQEKYWKLVEEVESAKIPADVKAFLKFSAARHLSFDYSKIADYYAKAPEEVQGLMEKSALVIIDFNKAIENGYIELSKKLNDLFDQDYAGDEN